MFFISAVSAVSACQYAPSRFYWASTQSCWRVNGLHGSELGKSEYQPLHAFAVKAHLNPRPSAFAFGVQNDAFAEHRVAHPLADMQGGQVAECIVKMQAGAFPGSPVGPACMCSFACYDIDNVYIEGFDVVSNRPKVAAYRAPGAPISAWAVESTVDMLAQRLNMDPIDLRLKNAARKGTKTAYGVTFNTIGMVETLEAAKNSPHYKTPVKPGYARGVANGIDDRADEIGELAKSFAGMQKQLLTDRLTGIANRESVVRRIEDRIVRQRRRGDSRPFAILFVDLNGFKHINDYLGHDVGDAVLSEIAVRLAGNVREEDLAARFGGDEFVVVLENVANRVDAMSARDKLERALAAPLKSLEGLAVDKLPPGIGAAIGVAVCPDDGHDLETLIKRADYDMYQRKPGDTGTDPTKTGAA